MADARSVNARGQKPSSRKGRPGTARAADYRRTHAHAGGGRTTGPGRPLSPASAAVKARPDRLQAAWQARPSASGEEESVPFLSTAEAGASRAVVRRSCVAHFFSAASSRRRALFARSFYFFPSGAGGEKNLLELYPARQQAFLKGDANCARAVAGHTRALSSTRALSLFLLRAIISAVALRPSSPRKAFHRTGRLPRAAVRCCGASRGTPSERVGSPDAPGSCRLSSEP